jgi:hypothetical protein
MKCAIYLCRSCQRTWHAAASRSYCSACVKLGVNTWTCKGVQSGHPTKED